MPFGHLHLHTHYSELDGMGKVKEIMEVVKSHGQTFLAMSDHGTMSGLWEGQCEADKLGLHFIHGCEFYYDREIDGKNGHLLVLAKNNIGLQNMFIMQKWAYENNFQRKPRITWEVLAEHSEGLIVTSACLGSPYSQYILQGDLAGAYQWAKEAKHVFGEDFYIEIQPNQLPEQYTVNMHSFNIAKELGIKLVATNDVHYVHETDFFPHEVMLAMQTKKKLSDEKRFRFTTNDFWVKTEEEMFESFSNYDQEIIREAIENTQEIANKCNARLEKEKRLPPFPDTPEGMTDGEYLRLKAEEGVQRIEEEVTCLGQSFIRDLDNELNVIDEEGYSGYFLTVQDYVNKARNNGIAVGDGRGSGAGSKTAYVTDITRIPPHEYDLLFERFMAQGRSPDFDVDFSDQGFVFRYLQEKHGYDNVARIVAFGTLTPKAAIRKVMNTFGHPMGLQNEITKLVPDLCPSLEEAYKLSPELLTYKDKYRTEWSVIERLEGVISHKSQHAGGVVIYPDLYKHLPVAMDYGENIWVAGFDKYMLEELGFYKFDVLGLETLPIIERCLNSIEKATGERIELHKIDLNDQKVYDMLCSGDVSGVFQLNNQAQKVMEQQPRNFRDLIAINSLIRPGVGDWNEYIARRKGKEWHKDPNRPWMHETEGTMTYQEQFLLDCHVLAGWDIAYADKHVRKNKNIRNDHELANKFMEDCGAIGILKEPQEAYDIWNEICDAVDGGYSFNKSHSASYAMLSFQTAWLKVHYPNHFYASVLSSEKTDGDGQEEIAKLFPELKERGIPVIPPNINYSTSDFEVTDEGIAYRITTVKHVGESAYKAILDMRPIKNFDDFMERRDKSKIKRNVLECLIKCGAFDFDEPNRAELLWKLEMSERTKTQIKQEYEVPRRIWNEQVKLEWEKEVLGLYLSAHPMERFGFKPIDAYQEGSQAIQGGIIKNIRIFNDKNGNEMAFVFIDSLYGEIKLIIFAGTWRRQAIQECVLMDNIVLAKGRKSGKDVLVDSLEVIT